MGIDSTISSADYSVLPVISIPPAAILRYWQSLRNVHPFLQYRFNNLRRPTLHDAMTHTYQNQFSTFFVLAGHNVNTDDVMAEFTLEGLGHRNRVSLIHFSFLPRTPLAIQTQVARLVHSHIFATNIRVLLGLTPVTNRPALIAIQKFGYKRLAEIPFSAHDEGEPVTGVLTFLDKESFNG